MGYIRSLLQGTFSVDIERRQKMLNQSFPTTCVLNRLQKLDSPCGVFANTQPCVVGQCSTPHSKVLLFPNVILGGKYAGVGKIHISPKALEDAWFFNNNRSVTVLLCNYQNKGRQFFCLLKQQSFSVGL